MRTRASIEPVSERSRDVAALGVDPLDAQIRQVYFFDTPELALNKAGVVVRARRVQQKGDDTVVKLRPVVPDQLPGELRGSPNFGVEVPTTCPDVPAAFLNPRSTWADPDAYDRAARRLAEMFVENFEGYADGVDPSIADAGPKPAV